jgi:dUTP pyrophosphatase
MDKQTEALVFKKYGGYILLEINSDYINYYEQIQTHNNTLLNSLNDPTIYVNDGFDLMTPINVQCEELTTINYNLRIQSFCVTETKKFPCGMKLYPRSSIVKTPLRLANGVGVIDSGYRGNILGGFDCFKDYTAVTGSRLLQLCASSVFPIYVTSISYNELSETNRGENGFGSSGI